MSRAEKRLTLRVPDSLHHEILKTSIKKGTSVNQTICDLLEFCFETRYVFEQRIHSDRIQAYKKQL